MVKKKKNCKAIDDKKTARQVVVRHSVCSFAALFATIAT